MIITLKIVQDGATVQTFNFNFPQIPTNNMTPTNVEISYNLNNQGLDRCLPRFPIRMMDVTAKSVKTDNGKDFVIRGAIVPPDYSPTATRVDDPYHI